MLDWKPAASIPGLLYGKPRPGQWAYTIGFDHEGQVYLVFEQSGRAAEAAPFNHAPSIGNAARWPGAGKKGSPND
jgi:hypothetical protein